MLGFGLRNLFYMASSLCHSVLLFTIIQLDRPFENHKDIELAAREATGVEIIYRSSILHTQIYTPPK